MAFVLCSKTPWLVRLPHLAAGRESKDGEEQEKWDEHGKGGGWKESWLIGHPGEMVVARVVERAGSAAMAEGGKLSQVMAPSSCRISSWQRVTRLPIMQVRV